MSDAPRTPEVPSSSAVPMGSGELTTTLPSKLIVTRGPGTFEVAWKWREQVPQTTFFAPLVPLMFAMNAILQMARHSPVAGALAFGAVGSLIGGFALAWGKNTVRVRVDRGVIELRSGPISLRRRIEIDDVVALVLTPSHPNSASARWGVTAVREDNKRTRIVAPILHKDQAQAITDLIHQALNGS